MSRTGILLSNMGTPEAPTPTALRAYLKEFLSDPKITGGNRILWWILLHAIILNTRPQRSAALYKEIWYENGSPLLVHCRNQEKALRSRLLNGFEVAIGMRYGRPSYKDAILELIGKGIDDMLLFPLYPQSSSVSSGSTIDAVSSFIKELPNSPRLRVVKPFYGHSAYIASLSSLINESLDSVSSRHEYLILSYHGIPASLAAAGDSYPLMCEKTSELLKPHLAIDPNRVLHCYHSRFGPAKWIEPYLEDTITNLARGGVRHIAIACPGFTSDCLETLHDIGIKATEQFRKAGGLELTRVPCLNSHHLWIDAMEQIIRESAM